MKRSRVLVCVLLLTVITTPMIAQERHAGHPAADLPTHEKFYSTWFMPDQPNRSCCNKTDCYPTEARFQNGPDRIYVAPNGSR